MDCHLSKWSSKAFAKLPKARDNHDGYWNGRNCQHDKCGSAIRSESFRLRDAIADGDETYDPTQDPHRKVAKGAEGKIAISFDIANDCKIDSNADPNHHPDEVEDRKVKP